MAIKIVLGTMEEHHVLSGQLGSYMGSAEWIYLERIAFAVRAFVSKLTLTAYTP